MKCHKYILRDNQQMCFTDYILSKRYYSSQEACEKDIGGTKSEYCFRVIAPFRKSIQRGRLAEKLTEHERR